MGIQAVRRTEYDILFVVSGVYEPGPEIRRALAPLHLGAGIVDVSIRLVRTLTKMEATARTPHLLVSLGVAYSSEYRPATLLQVESIVEAESSGDVELASKQTPVSTSLPFTRCNVRDVLGLPAAQLTAFRHAEQGLAPAQLQAPLVDPEGVATAKISATYGIPALIVRGTVKPRTGKQPQADFAEFHTPFLDICNRVVAAYSH